MAIRRVEMRLEAGGDAVMDVSPMIGNDVASIDAERLAGVDVAKHLFDLGPAFDLQQDVATGPHEGQRLEGSPRSMVRTMSMRDSTVP